MLASVAKDTKGRLLDAAECLFAQNGFDGTSLRAITSKAEVNLASVNYHFRSKDELIQTVFERRMGPINRRRVELLENCLRKVGEESPPLEEVIRAFLVPAMDVGMGNHGAMANFKTLMGRMDSEPKEFVQKIFEKQFSELGRCFTFAFQRALPDLPLEELFWRIHFLVGSLAHTLTGQNVLEFLSGGLCNTSNMEAAVDRLVAFTAAGMRVPAPKMVTANRGKTEEIEGGQP